MMYLLQHDHLFLALPIFFVRPTFLGRKYPCAAARFFSHRHNGNASWMDPAMRAQHTSKAYIGLCMVTQEHNMQQQSKSHVLIPWLANLWHAAPKIGPDTQLAAKSCRTVLELHMNKSMSRWFQKWYVKCWILSLHQRMLEHRHAKQLPSIAIWL